MRKRTTSPTPAVPSVAKPAGKGVPRVGYAVASLVGIFAILGAQLGLSIVLSDGAYQILTLERELADRSRDLDIVSEDIGHMMDPQAVAHLAVSLGMVQSRETSFLRLSDQAIIGSSLPASTNVVSVVDIVPGDDEVVVEAEVTLAATEPEAASELADIPEVALEEPADILLNDVEVDTLPITTASTTTPAQKFGGDLPAPTTR
jgi:hypothetical protein